jgi:hypothetical protein
MNVTELIEKLQRMPPNAVVVVPSKDHSYRKATVHLTKSNRSGDHFSEFFGPEYKQADEVVVDVAVVW